ncbi:winged helix-turn-helix transcriptional regulator [Agaribacter marinus]|nr:helix-turn-helix domain-containing protein [Agaribacter marinus]
MKKKSRSSCPINFGLEIFGDQWSLMIVRDIAFNQKSTYGDFLDAAEGISTNILAKRLAYLVASGVLTKRKCPENGRIIHYGLTDKGKSLIPILLEMIVWGADHGEQNPELLAWAASIRTDREQALKEVLAMIGD